MPLIDLSLTSRESCGGVTCFQGTIDRRMVYLIIGPTDTVDGYQLNCDQPRQLPPPYPRQQSCVSDLMLRIAPGLLDG